jgi:hypothetical protein
MKIVVYTAVFGTIDKIWSVPPPTMAGAEFVCFTDRPRQPVGVWTQGVWGEYPSIIPGTGSVLPPSPGWDIRLADIRFKSPRRTARFFKTHSHEIFPDADITIWLDGNVRLLLPPDLAARYWLGEHYFATFNHPNRNCLFTEAEFCAKQGKGSKKRLQTQVEAYTIDGMPRAWGLPETKCVIRRNTDEAQKINEAWWREIQNYSERDQVSLPYVFWNYSLRWAVIPGRAWYANHPDVNPAFWFCQHGDHV